jgi:hypothetical protein
VVLFVSSTAQIGLEGRREDPDSTGNEDGRTGRLGSKVPYLQSITIGIFT